mmetsp:Transcript_28310/g.74312  ORF Transcript_28310/g.74312 Transcript_28310/m.74312 type:complete len:310 (+) Transcript_28310:121-1050(+)
MAHGGALISLRRKSKLTYADMASVRRHTWGPRNSSGGRLARVGRRTSSLAHAANFEKRGEFLRDASVGGAGVGGKGCLKFNEVLPLLLGPTGIGLDLGREFGCIRVVEDGLLRGGFGLLDLKGRDVGFDALALCDCLGMLTLDLVLSCLDLLAAGRNHVVHHGAPLLPLSPPLGVLLPLKADGLGVASGVKDGLVGLAVCLHVAEVLVVFRRLPCKPTLRRKCVGNRLLLLCLNAIEEVEVGLHLGLGVRVGIGGALLRIAIEGAAKPRVRIFLVVQVSHPLLLHQRSLLQPQALLFGFEFTLLLPQIL